MKIKTTLAAAAAFAFSGGVWANIDVVAQPVWDQAYSLGQGTPFEDDYNIHLNAASKITFSAIAVDFGVQFKASNTTISLYQGNSTDSAPDVLVGSVYSFVSGLNVPHVSGVLTAGDYFVRINGVSQGTVGAAYSVYTSVKAAPAAPVPEPESIAMMLAGLGMLGAVARRRKID